MSSDSVHGVGSNMSETLSSSSDSGQGTTNETEDFQDDVSELYPLEIFETVKKGLRAERRVILHTNETKQCLQAIHTYAEAERLTPEVYRLSREFLSQVFPCVWKHVVHGDHSWESIMVECIPWGKTLAKIAIALLEKSVELEHKAYNELALRTFNCLDLLFEQETLEFQRMSLPSVGGQSTSDPVMDEHWPKSLAMEVIEGTINLTTRMIERFFSHQIFEEYNDQLSESLLETVLAFYTQVICCGIDKEVFRPVSNLLKSCIKDIRPSPVENFNLSFVSSPNMIEYIYRLIYYTDSVYTVEDTVGEFRRHLMKEQLNLVSFTSRLNAVRSLTSYLDLVAMFEDPMPTQYLQEWMSQEDIVGVMLASNVEKVHYAEQVLFVLERMVKANIFKTEHIDALWSLVEPDGVFEGLRDNVTKITGVLAKQLSSEHVKYIINRVEEGLGGDGGFISKSLIMLLSVLQTEDKEVVYVEPLMSLFWSVLLSVAKLDDTGNTFNFQECIRRYFDRGCSELPEKYLMQTIEILENGNISVTMLQVFVEMYLLFVESYPNQKPNIDPHLLLVNSLDRYHSMLAKMRANSEVLDVYYLCRIINQFLSILTMFSQSLSLELAKRIWDICVLNSLCEAERIDVLSWFQRMIDRESLFMTTSTLSQLLDERICREDSAEIDYLTFSCFKTCFCKVIVSFADSLDRHPAMDYLWKVFLETRQKEVDQESRYLLIRLYLNFAKEQDFLRRLMDALTKSLTALAHLETGDYGIADVLEKLYDEEICIEGKNGIYITRCIEALGLSLQQSVLEKHHPNLIALKSMLSRSESMNLILVFLADSNSSKLLRDCVCEVLDTLPVFQPLLQALNEVICTQPPGHLTTVMNNSLFPGKVPKYTTERTRYALRVLNEALSCLDPSRDDFEEIGCSCLLYILDAISRVSLMELPSNEVANSHQRLHGIGVEIVAQLMRKLKTKLSSTRSEHSSPEGDEIKDSIDRIPCSEQGSDLMEVSQSKLDAGSSGKDRDQGTEISSNPLKLDNFQISKFTHEEMSDHGCMSMDSVNGPVTGVCGTSLDNDMVQQKSSHLKSSLVLEKAIEYLIKVAHEGSSGWLSVSEPTDIDVQLVEMAVNQLVRMIEQWTLALDSLLAYPRIIDIIMSSLLKPLAKIRQAFLQLATQICQKSEPASNELYSSARNSRIKADLISLHCVEFYQLLEHFVRSYFQHPTPLCIEDAQSMLNELIQCIKLSPCEDHPEGLRLCRQLRLINVLISVLESESKTGVVPEGDLVLFLIKEILFPEAVLLKESQTQHQLIKSEEVQEIMRTKINPDCARHAAFELLLKLMKLNNRNLELALSCLNQLHFGFDAATREVAGSNASKPMYGYVGLQNGGATCYMNSIIQQLFMQPAVRDTILSAQIAGQTQDQSRCVFKALQKVFGYLAASNRRCYYPREFLDNFTHSDGTRVDVRQHHDALEFFQRTQELVDEFLVRNGSKPIIKNVVGTTHVQQIICKDNGDTYISESEQTYTSCSLDIVGKNNLHDSLEAYVQGELLEGPDAYHCEALNKKVPALKRLCLKSPPMNLVLQLKRFEMDYQLMETYKINDRFEFPLEFNIFPYTASGLMQKEGITKHNGEDGETSPKLHPAQCHYTLKGIVVHTGEIDGGHYYSFIKERPSVNRSYHECKWWRFDDSFVEIWDVSRLDEDCFGGTTELDIHETQRITKMNNAYILIYEHCSSNEEIESSSTLPTHSQNPTPRASPVSNALVPPQIEQEVLNDNLTLLAACRIAERNYMHFVLKLLKSIPGKADLKRRKMRRVTPPCGGSRGGSNCGSSPGSTTSGEKPLMDEPLLNTRGERTEDNISTIRSIASVVCEYIFKVILTPYVFHHDDGLEWVDASQIIVENDISCEIALQKLAEHADRSFRCLIIQGNEASREFLTQFLTRVIQSVDNQAKNVDTHDIADTSSISKFLLVVLDCLDHRWNINYDVSRVLDIACLIAEVLYRHGDHHTWLNLFETLIWKASRYSKIVYLQGRAQLMRSLDTTCRCIVRLLNSCSPEPPIEANDEPDMNPTMTVDANAMRGIEKMPSQKHLIKALLRPTILIDPGTVRLLILMSWDCEQGSLIILENMHEYLPDLESCEGEIFVTVVNAFLDILCVRDRYYSMKLSYLLFRGTTEYTPWKLIHGSIQNLLRWRLLYLLMAAFRREESIKQYWPSAREWEKVVEWMHHDIGFIPPTSEETWLDKRQIYQWAAQFADA